jgi:hypothetical protein
MDYNSRRSKENLMIGTAAPELLEIAEKDPAYEAVLGLLIERGSMPLLELSALTDLDESHLTEIVGKLEEQNVVRVKDRGQILDEIVTINSNKL